MRKCTWTLEKVKEVAELANSRLEFKKRYAGAYDRAKRMGWLEEACAHMIPVCKPKGYWNIKEKIAVEAKKYTKRSDFYVGSAGAYKAAIASGCLNEVCQHMGKSITQKKIYSREEVFVIAKTLSQRSDFAKKFPGAYRMARINGWLDECCSHMRKYSKDLTFEEVLEIAKKFQRRTEFYYSTPGVYCIAKKNGWFEEVCKHMPFRLGKVSREQVFEEAKKYRTRTEFYQSSRSYYRVALKHNWMNDCCAHMLSRDEMNKQVKGPWIFTKLLDEAKRYDSLKEFRKNSPKDYAAARKLGFIDDIRDFMSMN